MATFKELISQIIVKSNKKEELLEIVNDIDRIIEGINTKKIIITGHGYYRSGGLFLYARQEQRQTKRVPVRH